MLRRYNFFIRSLITILLVILPFIFFCLFIIADNIKLSRINVDKTQLENYKKAVTQINSIFSRLEAESYSFWSYLEKIFEGRELDAEVYARYFNLSSMKESFAIDMDVYFYTKGDKYIYSGSERMLYRDFETRQSDLDLSLSQFFILLNKVTSPTQFKPVMFPAAEGKPDSIAFIYPFRPRRNHSVNVVYFIKEDIISDIFNNYLGEIVRKVYIYDNNLNLIFTQDSENKLTTNEKGIFRIKGSGIIKQKINGISSVVMREVESEGRMTFVTVIPEKVFYSFIDRENFALWLLAAALAVICILSALLLTFSNYRPIRYLVEEIQGKETPFLKTNDIDVIRSHIQERQEAVDFLSLHLADQRPILENQVVQMLINGKFKSAQDFKKFTKLLDISLDNPFWTSLIVTVQETEPSYKAIENILSDGKDFLPYDGTILCGEIISKPGIIYVLNFNGDRPAPETVSFSIAQELYRHLSAKGNRNIIMGIGGCYRDYKMIRRSFYEASAANNTIGMKKYNTSNKYIKNQDDGMMLSRKEDYKDDTDSCRLPSMTKYLLEEALRNGDQRMSLDVLNDISEYVFSGKKSCFHIQLLIVDLLHQIVELSEQAHISIPQIEIVSILSFNDPDEFCIMFGNMIQQLCEGFRNNSEIQNKNLHDTILSYIEKNFTGLNFSLDTVSDEFNLTRSKISAIVKEASGRGFAQHIAFLKMNEIKRLLIESDKNIQDIIQEAGYLDPPNFMRKFKRTEGLTPGQYRASHRNTRITGE